VRLDRLFVASDVRIRRSIEVRSVTGYTRRFPNDDARSLVLATEVGGKPLSVGHGLPARLVAPGRRGFWWVKWVSEIDVHDSPWWWQPPLPLA
jgi:DMSO/TMAO reductase YedYZ molybdopterin-dependent catalytic subunit